MPTRQAIRADGVNMISSDLRSRKIRLNYTGEADAEIDLRDPQ